MVTEEVGVEETEDGKKYQELLEEYKKFKRNYVENIEFDPSTSSWNKSGQFIPPKEKEFAPLQLIHIYFDTNTYDEIQRNVRMTIPGMLGLIGGTMGLFTGFSILSAVEVLYYALKFLFCLKRTTNTKKKMSK